jgi:hypothetical protein
MTKWRRFLALAGVDRAVGWSAAPRIWSVLFGPITVAVIATRLTPEEQGYYFTFTSILAVQVLFELGFTPVIQQFASHERAFLEWQPDGTIAGNGVEKARLAALVQTAFRWYAFASIIFSIVLLTAGTLFFSMSAGGVARWQGPWIAIAVAAGVTLLLSPVMATLEGCGAVAEVARMRTEQVVAGNVIACVLLLAGAKLWAPAAAAIGSFLFVAVHLVRRWHSFFDDLLRTERGSISWREEVWPFQWRTALSWASGYLMFQSFTPLLFLFDGPAAAGRMGMTLTIVNLLLSISMAWLATKRPMMGMRVARRQYAELDALFFPAMARAAAVMMAGSVAFIGAAALLQFLRHPWRDRLLEPAPLLLLTGALVATQLFWSLSAYMRAHKQEAFLGVRLTSAVLVLASAWFLGRSWGATGMMAGFFAVTLVVSLGGGTAIFLRKRAEWHA